MQAKIKLPKPLFLAFLVLLNAIPVYGVFQWSWNSFDLIFLYWLENLVIGAFMILRMVARPYLHGVELVMPLFLVPFFTFHYGMFCFVHGQFVISLFGNDLQPELAGMSLPGIIMPLVESRHLFWPLMGLLAYQLIDWVRDVSQRGLGSDGIKELTTAPYRRIVVLHITIIGAGFAMVMLNEPLAGLILLIVFKTGMDVYNWNKDEHKATKMDNLSINENIKNKVDAFLENPKITINGKETHYKSFEELKASPHYGLMRGVLRMVGGKQQLEAIEAYVAQREKERSVEISG
jgi:hypothetical protein